MTACGEIKSVANKTFIFAKCEVSGSVSKTEAENIFKDYSIKFEEEEFTIYESNDVAGTYTYTFSNGVVTGTNVDDSSTLIAKISGEYIVIEVIQSEKDSAKVFFKVK